VVKSQTAILLIFFNRPDLAKISLGNLKGSDRDIYISIDGPRNNADEPHVLECIALAEAFAREHSRVDAVKLLIHKSNLGCKEAVRGAIDWGFETEERLIILEDDISFRNEFLETMDNWLEKFDHTKEIFHLNGYNPLPKSLEVDFSYLSRYTHVWGWATWKDRWGFYDRELETWKGGDLRLLPGLLGQDLSDDFCDYWNGQLLACSEGLNTWDVQWLYSQWRYGGFALTPGSRMTGNLGFDSRATHTKKSGGSSRERQPASHDGLFLNPNDPTLNLELNLQHDLIEYGIIGRHHFQNSLFWSIKIFLARKYLSILGIKLSHRFISKSLGMLITLGICLMTRIGSSRILKFTIRVWKFLSWRIFQK
jgi:hypothetical protein